MSVRKRELIHLIARHGDLKADTMNDLLEENIYRRTADWYRFMRWCLIALGAGFLVSGIVFFFAYNWDALHKSVKIGIIAALLLMATLAAVATDWPDRVKKILLTAASVLVGVLFAVFGQVYQTGADAFDFFLAWTVFIALWVMVSGFPPLWLGFLVLLNITIVSYADQIARDWSPQLLCTILFLFNGSVALLAHSPKAKRMDVPVPVWLRNVISLAAVCIATIGVIMGIFEKYDPAFPVLLASIAVLFPLAIHHGMQTHRIFYLAIIPLSLIVIISAWLIRISSGSGMLLLVSLFIVGSVTLVIAKLIELQKHWTHGRT